MVMVSEMSVTVLPDVEVDAVSQLVKRLVEDAGARKASFINMDYSHQFIKSI